MRLTDAGGEVRRRRPRSGAVTGRTAPPSEPPPTGHADRRAAFLRWGSWQAYLVVFASSLCTLVLEIVAGRVLAPVVGVTLFSWTSIIGVVLAGIAVGNYGGGWLARRSASPLMLATVLLAAGVATWMIAVAVRVVRLDAVLTQVPLLARSLVLVAALFFVPSALLGTVTPLAAQLTVRHAAEAGAVVGRLGALSAAGSIAGTFLTGFVLIPAFGSRTIVGVVAAALLALGIFVVLVNYRRGPPADWGTGATLTLGALLLVAGTAFAVARDENACLRETAYNCIRVLRYQAPGADARVLVLDRLVHGYVVPAEPRSILWGNAQAFADLAVYQAEQLAADGARGGARSLRALFIGGGGYTLPRYLASVYPGSRIDVLEIDPGVTATAQEGLGLRLDGADGAIRVRHGDARTEVGRLEPSTYDIVVGDAFADGAIPWQLTTLEFGRQVRRVLQDGGVYVADVTERWPSGRFLPAFVRTLREVFPYVTVVRATGEGWDRDVRSAWLIVGADGPLDAARLESLRRPGAAGEEPARARVVDPAAVEVWLARHRPPLLTDDYAPVDALLGPVLLEP